jgi:hypothetical protein
MDGMRHRQVQLPVFGQMARGAQMLLGQAAGLGQFQRVAQVVAQQRVQACG